jgi:hypothetical protein
MIVSMRVRVFQLALLVGLTLGASPAVAQQGYRWVDERGGIHYAGRRDQVPEQYRDQLPSERPGEPARPRIGPPIAARPRPAAPGECVLRFRGTERKAGASRFYPSCEACWKALKAMRGEEATRAECIASSIESYR